jgi:protein SCO1/2
LTGQVVSVAFSRGEVTIAHDAIPNYMTAMVMPFKVRDHTALAGLKAGDFIRGTLVVQETDGYLDDFQRTGEGELPRSPGPVSVPRVEYLIEGDRLPNARFRDETGTIRHLREETGKVVVMTFIYTRCPFPTFCPLMDRHFHALQRSIDGSPNLSRRVRLLSVTLDPDFDSPAVLRAHAERMQADPRVWSFLTPDEPAAAELSVRFGVTPDSDSSPGVIAHSLATAIIDPNGVVVKIFRGNEWVPRDVSTLLESILQPA